MPVPFANVLLVSAPEAVARAVAETVAQVRSCKVVRWDSPAALPADMGGEGIDLALAYLADSGGAAERAVCEFVRRNAASGAPVPVVVLTASPDAELKLRLFQLGVVDCLSAPLNLARLEFLVDVLTIRAREGRRKQPAAQPVRPPQPAPPADGSVFAGAAMEKVLKQCRAVAASEITVLLSGETGTGKTHFARVIHELSPRKVKPFMTVGCGTLTSSLVASELFGHVRGAFTGADADHTGKLAAAADGTVLLDDIDCMPLEMQTKLLGALEDRLFQAVGSSRTQEFRARLIAASNRPLEKEVAAGRLREDLYYRINVAHITLPPLREQPELISPLAEKFLADFARRHGRKAGGFSPAAMNTLQAHPWPGNIRQLRNVVERAVVVAEDTVLDVSDLPEDVWCENPASSAESPRGEVNELSRSRHAAEMHRLVSALQRHQNNRCRAAKELKVSRVTLYRKMHQYGLI